MNKKLIALCATGLLMASAVTVHAEDTMHTIYTTGTAKISIPADMATFQVTVDSRADNASAASSATSSNCGRSQLVPSGNHWLQCKSGISV